jgi:hypothetical protein
MMNCTRRMGSDQTKWLSLELNTRSVAVFRSLERPFFHGNGHGKRKRGPESMPRASWHYLREDMETESIQHNHKG